jgi:NADH-quinone oxidoreductase subunit J
MTGLDFALMILLVASAAATVAVPRLLLAVISLASTSAVLTVIMFRLNAPLAAVFELSVCAGLIPAIFISAIGLTRRVGPTEMAQRALQKVRRFWLLPVILVAAGIVLWSTQIPVTTAAATQPAGEVAAVAASAPAQDGALENVRNTLWNQRRADLLGQVSVLLAGALGVVVLLKTRKGASND